MSEIEPLAGTVLLCLRLRTYLIWRESFRAVSFEIRRIPCVVLTVESRYILQSSQYERIFHFFFSTMGAIDRNFRRQVLVDSPLIYIKAALYEFDSTLKNNLRNRRDVSGT